MKKIAALLALLILSSGSPAGAATPEEWIQKARQLRLAENPYWLRLLHYRRRSLGLRSDEDHPSFFLSPRGASDPAAELEATILALLKSPAPGTEDAHARCRFPLRYQWLKEQLGAGSDDFPPTPCPQFDAWMDKIHPQSASLIFAAAYLHNPASMYGHTFLRLDGSPEGGGDLNSYCVNFAAETNETSGVFFAVKGLAGFYPGKFSTIPFYFKVHEYNNIESRDLWEYKLSLTPDAVQRLRLHLWELGPATFNYFFLNENCSYQLLPLLEVADPKISASGRFVLKTAPIDTLRVLMDQPGLVRERKYRPSAVSEMLALRGKLGPDGIRAAEALARSDGPARFAALDRLPAERQGPALQAGYQYFRYLHGFPRFSDARYDAAEREILLRLNRVSVPSSAAEPENLPAPPESGHRSGRFGLGTGFKDGNPFQEIDIRPALHDLMDAPEGFIPLSRLEMFRLKMRHAPRQERVYLQKLTGADILSLSPIDRWIHKPSWRLFLGVDTAADRATSPGDGLTARAAGGSGTTVESHRWVPAAFYALGEVDFAVGDLERKYRAGPGGLAGLWLQPCRFWRISVEGEYFYYALGDLRGVMKSRAVNAFPLTKNVQIRAEFERAGDSDEMLVILHCAL